MLLQAPNADVSCCADNGFILWALPITIWVSFLLMDIKLTVLFNLQVPFEMQERNEVKRIESIQDLKLFSSMLCLF